MRSTRASESRNNNQRPTYSMGYVSPLNVPEKVKIEGYNYKWERKDVGGKPDYSLDQSYAEGWRPVPADRDSSFNYDFLGRDPLSSQYKSFKDIMLLERPKELCEEEQRLLRLKNESRVASIQELEQGNPFSNQTKINSF